MRTPSFEAVRLFSVVVIISSSIGFDTGDHHAFIGLALHLKSGFCI